MRIVIIGYPTILQDTVTIFRVAAPSSVVLYPYRRRLLLDRQREDMGYPISFSSFEITFIASDKVIASVLSNRRSSCSLFPTQLSSVAKYLYREKKQPLVLVRVPYLNHILDKQVHETLCQWITVYYN